MAASIAFHLALLVAIIGAPLLAREALVDPGEEAFGGEGPPGGGGGGTGGSGGNRVSSPEERVRYIQLAPAPPQQEPEPEVEVPTPVIPPPQLVEPPPPAPPAVTPDPAVDSAAAIAAAAPVVGAGGGTGNDGTTGSGPGTGGGIGSGVGTGTGSGRGPGTGGGGSLEVYPPTAIQVGLPPMNPPTRGRPLKIVALFDVDSTGKVLSFEFNPATSDRGYNRKFEQMLAQIRFRPAVTRDGRPIRHIARIEFEF
jgi:periplasmic protein TonB